MKSHILVTDECPTETQELFLLNEENGCVDEQALSHLGYRVEPKSKDENVRDYFLIDSDTGEQIHTFKDYLYENACNFALSYLGYSLFETDEDDYFGEETPENVLAFEL
jgi:hypothetical protein